MKRLGRCGVAASVTAAVALSSAAPAHAAEPHRVTYTVTADNATHVDVYYRDTDPPNWAAYSHNPYQFTPKVAAQIGPGHSWVLEVSLADPQRWAMVAATSEMSASTPTVRCELAIDGVVVDSRDGPMGALCSLRTMTLPDRSEAP